MLCPPASRYDENRCMLGVLTLERELCVGFETFSAEVAGIERKKRSWTSPLQHLFCAPLRIVPRALLRRSGSSCTHAPRFVLLSRLRAAMVMAHSCDSDNAPRTSPQRVRGLADLRGTSSPRCTAPWVSKGRHGAVNGWFAIRAAHLHPRHR